VGINLIDTPRLEERTKHFSHLGMQRITTLARKTVFWTKKEEERPPTPHKLVRLRGKIR